MSLYMQCIGKCISIYLSKYVYIHLYMHYINKIVYIWSTQTTERSEEVMWVHFWLFFFKVKTVQKMNNSNCLICLYAILFLKIIQND